MESDESGCTAISIENNNENAITGNQSNLFRQNSCLLCFKLYIRLVCVIPT